MNLNTLETLARRALKGGNIAEKSNSMLRSGQITPVEHRSLSSLSWQIAGNVRADGIAAGTYAASIGPVPNRAWW